MGYYTSYELSVVDGEVDAEMLKLDINNIGYDFFLGESQEAKWYDHERDMRSISDKHPNVLFKLHGEGEEAGDLWNKYFLNGLMQVCMAEVVYPKFDKGLLK